MHEVSAAAPLIRVEREAVAAPWIWGAVRRGLRFRTHWGLSMRLTLRTLLAYMDDVLDPSDHEELGKKIEASEFATELIHRTRDVVRRLRLGTPDLESSDDDLHSGRVHWDPNLVAEYLDNTVDPEEVAEFERTCLDAGPQADQQLAEVASCHHILAMVLGEPAEVDETLRLRLQGLEPPSAADAGGQPVRWDRAQAAPSSSTAPSPQPHSPPSVAPSALAVAAPAAATMAASWAGPTGVDAVPEYLREAQRGRQRGRRWFAAAALGTLLGGALAYLFWPAPAPELPPGLAVGGAERGIDADALEVEIGADVPLPSDSARSSADGGVAPAWTPAVEPPASTDAALRAAPRDAVVEGAATEPPTVAPTPPETLPNATFAPSPPGIDAPPFVAIPEPFVETELDVPAAPGGVGTGPTSGGEFPAVEAPAEGGLSAGPLSDSLPSGPAEPGAATARVPAPPAMSPATSPATSGLPEAGSVEGPGTAPLSATPALLGEPAVNPLVADAGSTATSPADEAGPAASRRAGPVAVGSYPGNRDMLLRWEDRAGAWVRVPPRSTLVAGDRLMGLPTFRTHVVLADANVYLSGAARVELSPNAAADAPSIRLVSGRLVINAGLVGNVATIEAGQEPRVLELAGSSSLAIEVRRPFTPGRSEPLADPVVTWHLTSGSCKFRGGSREFEKSAPVVWETSASGDELPRPIEQLPAWIDREGASPVERRAQEDLNAALESGVAVSTRLLELSDPAGRGRRAENRALAAQCAAQVGLFEPLVKSLADVQQKAAWRTQVETIRAELASQPEAVGQLRETLVALRGEEAAADLEEMLLGYGPEQVGRTREEVREGALQRLIERLNSDQLDYRVLALHNLNELTGTSSLGGYQPQQSEGQRERALRYYRERLEKGTLAPRAESP